MANPSLQIGNSNWAIKEDNLLGYSTAGTRFVPQPITMTRASAGTRVNSSGLVETVELLGSEEVTNGDFSNGLNNWTVEGAASYASIVNGALNSNNTNAGNWYAEHIEQDISFVNGTTYKVTFKAKNISGNLNLRITQNATVISTENLTDSFVDYSVLYTANLTGGSIRLFCNGAVGQFEVDDISVKEYTSNNLARVDYNGTASSLLAEPQRTNLVANSDPTSNEGAAGNIAYETFSWGLGTLIENSVYYADNTVTRFRRLGGSLVASTYYAFSFYCIKDDLSAPTFALGVNDDFIVKLNGLQVSQSLDDIVIKDKGNGVYFITIASDRGTGSINVIEKTAANTSIGFRVSGFQIEEGSYATSYIPTSGSTVTRVQDQYSKTGISNLINSTEGVLFAETAALSDNDGTYRSMSISDSSRDNEIEIDYTNDEKIRVLVKSGGGTIFSTSFIIDTTIFNKVAVKYKLNDFAVFINGTEEYTLTSGAIPIGLNRLAFDRGDGGTPFYAKVKQLQVFKTALTDSELIALTT